jgi:surfactin synthase thioesterase subunit
VPGEPLILYVPGLLPKPEAELHREQLLRCLLAAVRRLDEGVAGEIEGRPSCFDLVSWTYDFYGEHRDLSLDLPNIELALAKTSADEEDIRDAVHWKRRLMHASYKMGDLLPFLIPRLANERLELHLRDVRRYTQNENDIAEHVRRLLKVPIEAAAAAGRPILLLTHSMGSVIAWDALWQMSRRDDRSLSVGLWMTMGSPLGGNYVQKRLLGLSESADKRYPANVRRWVNIAAIGELTALDRNLRNDFAPMLDYGLVEDIEDHEIFTFYRDDGALNVHNEYGYLMHEVTGQQVCAWWRAVRAL